MTDDKPSKRLVVLDENRELRDKLKAIAGTHKYGGNASDVVRALVALKYEELFNGRDPKTVLEKS